MEQVDVVLVDKVRPWVKKVYGPYLRKDGRKHVVLWDGKRTKTVSYPKWLMEQHIGRELGSNETIDHKNRDFTDDRIENLQILSFYEHGKLDAIRVRPIEITCIWCRGTAFKKAAYQSHNGKMGKAGPFCSKKCSGEYGAEVQHGREDKRPPQRQIPIEEREYYRIEKDNKPQ